MHTQHIHQKRDGALERIPLSYLSAVATSTSLSKQVLKGPYIQIGLILSRSVPKIDDTWLSNYG